jgi:hypothetical protein
MVTLNKLCYIDVLAEKRAAVRVELDPPLKATMQCEDQTVEGAILDISIQGIAMEVKEYLSLGRGTDMTVKFMLPDFATSKQTLIKSHASNHEITTDPALSSQPFIKQTLIKVPATLVDIEGSSSPYRYKLRIMPEKHQEQLISRYSFHRQVEIIHGLKEQID